ncbi:MAG: mitochondrial fission ELM1 family protein [Alphaproteobacteria bacterium]
MTDPVCWTLTDGRMGMVAQALGLAEAVGLPIVQKTITPRGLLKTLPPGLWPPRATGFDADDPQFQPPWPRLLIACGRHAVGPSLAIRRLSGGRTFVVVTQDPYVNPRRFDLVVVPEHDRLTGPNVIQTTGAVHRVNQHRLASERRNPAVDLSHLPRPLVSVSIGGPNRAFGLGVDRMARIVSQLKALTDKTGASLAVTASRRTGNEAETVLRRGLQDTDALVWDGTGQNPYFSFLAQADAVLVTQDSVNMISEACATGKPVYVIKLDRRSNRPNKFDRFHDHLFAMDAARPFAGTLDVWSPPVLDESARVAAEIRARIE